MCLTKEIVFHYFIVWIYAHGNERVTVIEQKHKILDEKRDMTLLSIEAIEIDFQFTSMCT